MEKIIEKAFINSFNDLCCQVNEKTFRHINESVYRYLFIKHLPEGIGVEDEWHRIDLLLHDPEFQYPIEFKLYDTRPLFLIGMDEQGKKGGAGNKNFQEFLNSAKKLAELRNENFYLKKRCNFKKSYFVLIAGDRLETGKKRFDYWYCDQNRHLAALAKMDIKSQVIAQEECVKSSLKIFGWVIEVGLT